MQTHALPRRAPPARSAVPRWWKPLWFVLSLVPLTQLVVRLVMGELGANPVETVIRSTGFWTITMLCVVLAITPLRWLTGWAGWIRQRRMAGLFVFFYACVHLLSYAGLDLWFDLQALWVDIQKRPFITVGMLAWVLLLLLALTSTQGMMRRLGRRWGQLHRAVYVIAPLAALHFYWDKAGKNDWGVPAIMASILGGLLLARLVRNLWRKRQAAASAAG